MLKQQQEEAASRECTFHPVINHRSDRLMAERSEVLRVRAPCLQRLVCCPPGVPIVHHIAIAGMLVCWLLLYVRDV